MKKPIWYGAGIILALLLIILKINSFLPHHLGATTGKILFILVILELLLFAAKKLLPKKAPKLRNPVLKKLRFLHCPTGYVLGAVLVLHLICTINLSFNLVQISGCLTALVFLIAVYHAKVKGKVNLHRHGHLALLALIPLIIHVISHTHH